MKVDLGKYYPLIPVYAILLIMFVIGKSMTGKWELIAMLAFYCALGQAFNIFLGMTGYVDFGYVAFLGVVMWLLWVWAPMAWHWVSPG